MLMCNFPLTLALQTLYVMGKHNHAVTISAHITIALYMQWVQVVFLWWCSPVRVCGINPELPEWIIYPI